MKNSILISALVISLLLSTKAYCQNNTQKFMQNLATCSEYLNNNDNKIQIILGWSSRKCYFKEIGAKEEVFCGLKLLELKKLIENLNNETNFDIKKGLTSSEAINEYIKNSMCSVKEKRTPGEL